MTNHPPLAAAGLAEAAYFFAALILLAGMILLAIGLVVTWRKRSRIGLIFSIVACIGIGGLLQPWAAFRTHEGMDIEGPKYDPDVESWVARWRFLSGLWVVLALGTITAGGRVLGGHGHHQANKPAIVPDEHGTGENE